MAGLALALTAAGCTDVPTGAGTGSEVLRLPDGALLAFTCAASRTEESVRCAAPPQIDAHGTVIGGQNVYLTLTGTNVSYDPGTEIFQFDVTVQNLMNEAIGTPDGTTADPNGIRVFFQQPPTVTGGTGEASIANADGVATITGGSQAYYQYNEVLSKDEVSGTKPWQMNVSPTVDSFNFIVAVATDVQYLLVINEVLVNPAGTVTDANGEWIELYNAGTLAVELQGLVIADSAAAGRRAYQPIGQSLVVSPGAYVTLGKTTNTTNNGGVPIDYVHTMLGFPNSLGAFKIARVYGTDTLTVDRTQFASAAISAQNGVSRELLNPALDNSDMDGSNWGDAAVTAVYGPGGRGTPKAQNSVYTP